MKKSIRLRFLNLTALLWFVNDLLKKRIIKVTEEAGLYIDDFADYAL